MKQILAFLSLLALVASQIDIKTDSKLILCEVCNNMIDSLSSQISNKRETAPYNKINEETIQDLIHNICSSGTKEGEWIRKIDIIQKNSKTQKGQHLELQKPGGISKCGEECKTIAKSCGMLFDDSIDPDDLSALLWKNKHTTKDIQVSSID